MTEEPIKVVLFAADCGGYDIERSMEELAALAQANGMEAVAEVVQKRETPEAAAQLAVTDDVLGELGCGDIPQIVVYNKCDRVENAALFDTSAVRTSTVTGEGLDALLARLDAALAGRVRRIAVLLPYDKLGEATPMRENGTVLTEEYRPEGVYLEGIVKTMDLHRFTPYLV